MVYEFGEFRLDRDRYQLLRCGEPLHIEPLALELLVHLIEHRDRVVSKEELLEALWADRFVSDAVLARCVHEARQSLRDDSERQRFIKTIRGRGYGFGAEVDVADGESPMAATAGDGEGDSPPWEPAIGQTVPHRPHWILRRKLGDGGFGSVWLASRDKSQAKRTFKFCFDPERLHGLEREVVLFRLLEASLGEREDITRVLDWQFDEEPYFLETAYTPGGDLVEWSETRGGIAQVPLEVRLELVAQVAVALGAAHSAGVLHKDIKPSNILIRESSEDGGPRASLTDFGVGLLTDRELLRDKGITAAGLTETLLGSSGSGTSGTRLYMAPEVLEGRAPTIQSDLYALGLVLYQAVRGDFASVLAPGWEREIDDALLREDIAACVDGDPELRLADASELARRLRTLEERRAERAAAARLQEEVRRSRRRRRQLGVAAVVGLALSVAVATVAWRESRLRQQSEELRYVSSVQLADNLLAQGNPGLARNALLRTPERLRGWEWGYLVNRAWQETLTDVGAVAELSPGETAARLWDTDDVVVVVTLSGHAEEDTYVRFAADGQLLSWATDVLKIWNLDHEQVVSTVDTGSRIRDATLSHDGKTLVTTDDNGIADLWDAARGRRLQSLGSHTGTVIGVWFSPDDSLLVISSGVSLDTFELRIWETETGQLQHILPEGTDSWPVLDLQFLAGGTRLLTPSRGQSLRTWDLSTGRETGRTSGPASVDRTPNLLSPDGTLVLSTSIRIHPPPQPLVWSTTSGEALYVVPEGPWKRFNRHMGWAFSPDSSVLGAVFEDGTVYLLESRSGDELATFAGVVDSGNSLAWSPDGSRLAVGQKDGLVRILAPASKDRQRRDRLAGHEGRLLQVVWSADGTRLASVSVDDTVKVWDVENRRLLHTFPHPEPPYSAELSPNGQLLRTATWTHTRLWDVVDGALRFELPSGRPGNPDLVRSFFTAGGISIVTSRGCFSPDSSRLVLPMAGEVGVIDTSSGETVFHLGGPEHWHMVYGPTGSRIIAVGSQKPAIKLWDAATGEELNTLQMSSNVTRIDFSHDGSLIVAGSMEGTVKVWEADRGVERLSIPAHQATVWTARFDATGELLLIASEDRTASIWNVATGQRLTTLAGHRGAVINAVWSPDGERILTHSHFDNTARIWDLEGHELLVISPEFGVSQVRWSPDGRTIASSLADGTIGLWETVPRRELAAQGGESMSFEERLRRWRQERRP